MADSNIFIQLGSMLHHQCDSPCWLTANRKFNFGKITCPLVSCDGLGMGLKNWKMDNGHSLVGHSPWVPPYSIELLIKVRIVIAFSMVNLGAHVDILCINQWKDLTFAHVFSPPGYHDMLCCYLWEFWCTHHQLSLNACALSISDGSLYSLPLDLNNIHG